MRLPGLSPETEHLIAQLQPRLLRYFAARVTDKSARQDLVGRVNERLLQRLSDGAPIDDVERFAFGVSRNVLQEYWREQKRRRTDEATLTSTVENLGNQLSTTIETGPHTRKALLRALHECVESLEESERLLAERCYGEGKSKDNREQLAAELNLTRNALDARISRLRGKLEQCVRQKLSPKA